jgi:hypothetical protein
MHAGRSYRPSLHARICDSAQVPSLESLTLRTDHSSVKAAPAAKHGKRCDPYLPEIQKMRGDIYRCVTFLREATRPKEIVDGAPG